MAHVPVKLTICNCSTYALPEFTPAWRGSGLPSKPSHLRLIPAKAAAGALIDPARVTQHVAQVEAREVLSPPRVFEYDDDTVEPHHLQATGNLKVGWMGCLYVLLVCLCM